MSNFSPILKSLVELLAIALSSQVMLFGVKVLSDGFKSREKSLYLSRRFESSHPSFSRSSRLMGILGSIVQSLMLSMLHVRHHLLLRCFVTFEFVSDNHPWHEALFFEEFAEESLRRLRVPVSLQQDIQHVRFPIHYPPQIILLLFERHRHLIKMPFVFNVPTFAPKLIRILLPEFLTPFSNCFVSHLNPSIS